jgi:transposase
MEATGVYHENCSLFLNENSYAVSVIIPNKAKRHFQSLGLKSKNDSINANGLVQMSAEQKLESWSTMSKEFYSLRPLTRHYQSLQERKTSIENQMHAEQSGMYVTKMAINDLNVHLRQIEKQLKELMKSIMLTSDLTKKLQPRSKHLHSQRFKRSNCCYDSSRNQWF